MLGQDGMSHGMSFGAPQIVGAGVGRGFVKPKLALILFLIAAGLSGGLAGCAKQPINPDRPPLDDYEPPPIGTWPEQQGRGLPGRV